MKMGASRCRSNCDGTSHSGFWEKLVARACVFYGMNGKGPMMRMACLYLQHLGHARRFVIEDALSRTWIVNVYV